MKLSDFDYTLSADLVAQYPLGQRDQARMMVLDRSTGEITHDHFFNIGAHLPPRTLFIVNNSKVVPARLLGRMEASGREVEVFLLKALDGGRRYTALLRPLKKITYAERIVFGNSGLWAKLIDHKQRIVEFNQTNVAAYLKKIGHMPLPPYIRRSDEPSDREDYQTVYAKPPGSVAAPTAGLHFTKSFLNALRASGHELAPVTLHVGDGTFRPVQVDDITHHKMHVEEYTIAPRTLGMIQKAKQERRKVLAVGTTSCRALETFAQTGSRQGSTDLFVYPGFSFTMTDMLLTNFHLPKSTLLMLVCAFASRDLVMRAYREAIKERYRFYSYGDCMLIK